MAKEHIKCLTSYIIRELQIESVRCHYPPLKWMSYKSRTTLNVGQCEQQKLLTAGGNAKWGHHFGRQFLFTYDPQSSFYPTDLKIYFHTRTCMQMFITALFIIVDTWKQ